MSVFQVSPQLKVSYSLSKRSIIASKIRCQSPDFTRRRNRVRASAFRLAATVILMENSGGTDEDCSIGSSRRVPN